MMQEGIGLVPGRVQWPPSPMFRALSTPLIPIPLSLPNFPSCTSLPIKPYLKNSVNISHRLFPDPMVHLWESSKFQVKRITIELWSPYGE